METIAFYSYKGGVGRSLLVANAARFLATAGKGVVAVDFDFEAPGLHYKFGVDSRDISLSSGGAVPYLNATAEGSASAPPITDHMVAVPVPIEAGGWLRLMPAGPAPSRTYWSALKNLSDRLRLIAPSGNSVMALLDLQTRIADELQPDYLLIDARTGVTELGGLAATLLADTVVCMLVPNLESLEGTLAIVEALKDAHRLPGQKTIRVLPVVSRTSPADVDDEWSDKLHRLAALCASDSKDTGHPPEVFFLPHDAKLGTSERIVAGDRTASTLSPLHRAWLELFQALFPSLSENARQTLDRLGAVVDASEGRSKT